MENEYISLDESSSPTRLKIWHPKVEDSNFFDHKSMVLTSFRSGHLKFYLVCKDVAIMDEDLNNDNWYMAKFVFFTIKDSRMILDLEYMAL